MTAPTTTTAPTRWGVTVPERARELLIATHETHRPAEQAALLGVAIDTVWTYKTALYHAGVLRRAARATQRPRTEAEDARAVALARQGLLGREIAAALGRSPADISEWLAPHGGIHALRASGGGDAWLSREATARLVGVHPSVVRRWVACGALVAGRTKELDGRRRGSAAGFCQVTRAALADFLRDERRYWMEYTPRAVQDAELRRLAETVRAAAGGRWEKLRPLAGRCAPATYSRWRAAGWPGSAWEVTRSGTADWVWVPQGSALPDLPARGERWRWR